MQSALDRISDLFLNGRCLQAYEASRALGSLGSWRGAKSRVLAGRLARELGNSKLARACFIRGFREHPEDWDVREFYAYEMFGRRGPLATLRLLQQFDHRDAPPGRHRAQWHALYSQLYVAVRDFSAAEIELQHAMREAPDDAWVWLERASLEHRRDERELAVEYLDRAIELRPNYATATIYKSDLLRALRRDDEALALLTEASTRIDSGRLWRSRAMIFVERDQHQAALESFAEAARQLPLMDKGWREHLSACRCDSAYRLGDFAAAAAFARQVDTPFYKAFAERLSADKPVAHRVELAVPFVQQNNVTCAPATLASIAAYYSRPAEHLEIAAQICYDGTSSYNERTWLEQNGYLVREFTLDWNSAVTLLDRGIPLALETRGMLSAHLQAICGYDTLRNTLLVRDPGDPDRSEFCAKETLEAYASVGPRAAAAVPVERAALLDGVDLPDAAHFDELFAFYAGLERHDRSAAVAALRRMEALGPKHRLTLAARERLAHYDGNQTQTLEAAQEQLALYPDDNILRMRIARCLDLLGRQSERLKMLAELVALPKRPVVFWREYAIDLAADGRRHDEAMYWFDRVLRYLGFDADTLHHFANFLWDHDRAAALLVYRWASCLDDKEEWHASTYFKASRHLKRTDEALAWLRERYVRYRDKASGPTITLVDSLIDLDLMHEALRVMDEALERRPNDSHLATYAANCFAVYGQLDKAAALLAKSEPFSRRASWLRASIRLAEAHGDCARQLELRRELAEIEPHFVANHDAIVDLLTPIEGAAAALQHFTQVARDNPHHLGIQQAYLTLLGAHDVEAALALAQEILKLHECDAWTMREIARLYGRLGRHDEALAVAKQGQRIDPHNADSYGFIAHFLANMGRRREAWHEYRRALEISIDRSGYISKMLECCDTTEQKKETLAFIHAELLRQTTFGDGLIAYLNEAEQLVPADERMTLARRAVAERPDLWHSHAALLGELNLQQNFDEALEVATRLSERFPLVPGSWRELAGVHRARSDRAAEIAALTEAARVNPNWGSLYAELAEAHEAAGEADAAKTLLTSAIARLPLQPNLRVYLADLQWRTDERESAAEMVLSACRLDANYGWAWEHATEWLRELGKLDRLRELTLEMTRERPADAVAWYRRGQALELATESQAADPLAALAAYDNAVRINPQHQSSHCLRVDILAAADRLDEAIAASRPAAWPKVRPDYLRCREGYLLCQKGDFDAGLAVLESLVADSPDFTWGWEKLYDCLGDHGNVARRVQITERWTQAIGDANAWNYAAAAQIDAGNVDQAISYLRKAIELDPENEFAHRRLVNLYCDANNLYEASQFNNRLREFATNTWSYVASIDVNVRQNSVSAVISDMRELATTPTTTEALFEELAKKLRSFVPRDSVRSVVAKLIDDPDTNVGFAQVWQAFFGRGFAAMRQLMKSPAPTPAWHAVARMLLKAPMPRWRLRWFLWRKGDWLRKDNDSYDQVTVALITACAYGAARSWTSAWREPRFATTAELFNPALARWLTGNFAEAVEINRRALTFADDGISPWHRVFVASYELAYGDPTTAIPLLIDIDAGRLLTLPQQLFAFAKPAALVFDAIARQDAVALRSSVNALHAALRSQADTLRVRRWRRRLVWRTMSRVAAAANQPLRARWYAIKAWW